MKENSWVGDADADGGDEVAVGGGDEVWMLSCSIASCFFM